MHVVLTFCRMDTRTFLLSTGYFLRWFFIHLLLVCRKTKKIRFFRTAFCFLYIFTFYGYQNISYDRRKLCLKYNFLRRKHMKIKEIIIKDFGGIEMQIIKTEKLTFLLGKNGTSSCVSGNVCNRLF